MKWENTNDRFIGFFDIMGFKNLVLSKPHEEIEAVMKNINSYIFSFEHEAKKLLNESNEDFLDYSKINLKDICDDQNGKKELNNKISQSIVRPVIFSDSILIVSNTKTVADALKIFTAGTYILHTCLRNGIPVKGAMSCGTFTADFENSIYFGQPLIDAYLLEESLYMYGAVCDHNVEAFLDENYMSINREIQDVFRHLLSFEDIPFKSKRVSHAIINPYGIKTYADQNRENLFRQYHNVSGETRKYVDNTIEVYSKLPIKNE